MSLHAEPTLDDLLSDPLTLSLMAADRIDPARLRVELRSAAARMGRREAVPSSGEGAWADLLRSCVEIAGRLPREGAARLASEPRLPW